MDELRGFQQKKEVSNFSKHYKFARLINFTFSSQETFSAQKIYIPQKFKFVVCETFRARVYV